MKTCEKHFYCVVVYEARLNECPVCASEEILGEKIESLKIKLEENIA